MLASTNASSQSATPKLKKFPLWNFDEGGHTCRAKGRLQDKEYCDSKLMDAIIAQRQAAIPILILQLTDSRETKEPIYDYWSQTTAGDIAYFILNDLFTDSNWTTFNMPGLEALKDNCNEAAETCWRSSSRSMEGSSSKTNGVLHGTQIRIVSIGMSRRGASDCPRQPETNRVPRFSGCQPYTRHL